MVPGVWVVLEALPLSPSGKVDKQALPAPEGRAGVEKEYVAPRTDIERAVAGVVGGLLGLERVGVEDDFFELGGHSLLATQVVSRVREAYGVEVTLRSLFEHPTVAGLAQVIEKAHKTELADLDSILDVVHRVDKLSNEQVLWELDEHKPGIEIAVGRGPVDSRNKI